MPPADSHSSIVPVIACVLGVPLVVYFGFFGLLLLDFAAFDSYIFGTAPPWLQEGIRTIYWPLIAPFQT